MSLKILLFGYGRHGKYIAKGLVEDDFEVHIVEESEKNITQAINDGFLHCFKVDVTQDEALITLHPENFTQLVCVMDDEHLNVFLTLSLRSLFQESEIIAISDSIHTTQKLEMAGANKVIDLYEVSANKIHNILHRPITTKLLEEFVMHKNGIAFEEMVIPDGSFLDGMMTDKVDLSKYSILLVGMIDEALSKEFIFITGGINHRLDVGDTLVCIGEQEDLKRFAHLIYSKQIPL